MQHICLLGVSFTTGNRGVSALASSIVKIATDLSGSLPVKLVVPGRSDRETRVNIGEDFVTVSEIHYRRDPRGGLSRNIFVIVMLALLHRLLPVPRIRNAIVRANPVLQALSDAIVVGDAFAGDSFSDIYGLGRLFTQSLPRLALRLLGKRYTLLPQTYGPYETRLGRFIARRIIRGATTVLIRSVDSTPVSRLFRKSPSKTVYCPDVAFMLPAKAVSSVAGVGWDWEAGPPIIGVNVSGLLYNGGYNRQNMFGLKLDYPDFASRLVRELLATRVRVLLIPHTYTLDNLDHVENDLGASIKLSELISVTSDKLSIVSGDYDQHEIKGVISRCSGFVGSRMHSCIASLSQGIPAVGVAYSHKFQDVFHALGVSGLVVDARSTDTTSAVERVLSEIESRERWRTVLSTAAPAAREVIISRLRPVFAFTTDGL